LGFCSGSVDGAFFWFCPDSEGTVTGAFCSPGFGDVGETAGAFLGATAGTADGLAGAGFTTAPGFAFSVCFDTAAPFPVNALISFPTQLDTVKIADSADVPNASKGALTPAQRSLITPLSFHWFSFPAFRKRDVAMLKADPNNAAV
jgi:hypothetical protein